MEEFQDSLNDAMHEHNSPTKILMHWQEFSNLLLLLVKECLESHALNENILWQTTTWWK
jgi:hypothetical protein